LEYSYNEVKYKIYEVIDAGVWITDLVRDKFYKNEHINTKNQKILKEEIEYVEYLRLKQKYENRRNSCD
jgi:ABC-type transporter MlaC component